MKDKELRSALEDSGVVKTVMDRDGGEFLQVLDVEGQLNAICEYLEIKLSRVPERIVAKRKNAPQNAVEAKPEQHTTQSVRQPEEPASARA